MNRRATLPTQFLNRELGILALNRRVLAMAADDAVPLLERLRFITIVSSNLDEFFEIRVAGLKESIKLGLPEPGPDARPAAEVFDAVSREAHALVAAKYKLLNDIVLPALAREGIVFPRREEWNPAQRQWIREFFFRELLPVLTPIGLDPAHPFPRVFNKSLNFAVELEGRDAFGRSSRAAIVQAPRALPRLIRLPKAIAGGPYSFVFLSSILHAHVGELFAGDRLRERFEQEALLTWSARLEKVGQAVVYGVVGHKTHAKTALVVRREDHAAGKALRRYVHLSTGNYHPATARQYTDFGLMTANEDLCADVNEVFKQLTGLGRAGKMKHVWQSPFTLHRNIIAAIRGEAKLAAEGKPARIIAKMNSLLEQRIIEELYAASAAGVRIDLIVRGVCALKPGIAGLSENIRVRSIIGRFLEHSRVFYFQNGGSDEVYLASADWMDRNFFRRIELCFPVLDPALKRRVIREGLQPYLDDNCQAWEMAADGSYEQLKPRRRRRSAQEELLFTLATPS